MTDAVDTRVVADQTSTRHPRLVLAVILVTTFMTLLDNSIVFIGVPIIRSDLHFSDADVSWVSDSYSLVFGGLLLLAARCADVVGRRRLDLRIWQVPRDVYRQSLVTFAEIETRIRPHGALGEHLADELHRVARMGASHGVDLGETYVLGDSPLVLLTALQSSFQPDPSSSASRIRPRLRIGMDGAYEAEDTNALPVRVWERLDVRLLFEDLYAKLALHNRGSRLVVGGVASSEGTPHDATT